MKNILSAPVIGAMTLVSAVAVAQPVSTPQAATVTPAPAVTPAMPVSPPPATAGGAIVAVQRPSSTSGVTMLPVNTELLLTLNREVNSKQVKQGEMFPLTVTSDVMLGDYIVIPRGTPATGEVTYRTGKGAFGKSAKMEIDLRSIDLNGRRIPISGHYREEGSGNTGATVGTAVAAGPFAAFVTGRSAIFKQDREFRAQTREAIPVTFEK